MKHGGFDMDLFPLQKADQYYHLKIYNGTRNRAWQTSYITYAHPIPNYPAATHSLTPPLSSRYIGTPLSHRRTRHRIRTGRLLHLQHLGACEPSPRATGQNGDLDDHNRRADARGANESDSCGNRGERCYEEVYTQ